MHKAAGSNRNRDVGPVETQRILMIRGGAKGLTQKICTTLSRAIGALTSSNRTSSVSLKELAIQVEQYWKGLGSEMEGELRPGMEGQAVK